MKNDILTIQAQCVVMVNNCQTLASLCDEIRELGESVKLNRELAGREMDRATALRIDVEHLQMERNNLQLNLVQAESERDELRSELDGIRTANKAIEELNGRLLKSAQDAERERDDLRREVGMLKAQIASAQRDAVPAADYVAFADDRAALAQEVERLKAQVEPLRARLLEFTKGTVFSRAEVRKAILGNTISTDPGRLYGSMLTQELFNKSIDELAKEEEGK